MGGERRHLQQSDLLVRLAQDCAGNQILSRVKVEKQKPSATIGLGGEVGSGLCWQSNTVKGEG